MNSSTTTERADAKSPDRRIYKRHPNRVDPHCIYFYYIDGSGDTQAYFLDAGQPIPERDLSAYIEFLAANAVENTHYPPKLQLPLKWRRKSYIAIVLDSDAGTLNKDGAVVFKDPPDPGYRPNYCFYDGLDTKVNIPDGQNGQKEASAVCFVNYMTKNDAHDVLGKGEEHQYLYSINYTRRRRPIVDDTSGTNLGPPVPPP